ncbi:M16 family metallopeptidase [Hippea sp. KM1]|uniref:M16 family metallopeptidase n=1 Tax=Hippea sp. KM1 TaxID=944481 RepID=UPI00046CA18C|nr:pitrilysin family protein [Hippea sp. KM1]
MHKRLLLALFLVLIGLNAHAKYNRYVLSNGLEVYLEKNNTLPIVNVTILYRVGCVDEYNSITGISHMLEHMNFRGSKHFKDGYIDELTSRFGGVDNAQTSFDYTLYFCTISKKALKDVLSFYADNMDNLLLKRDRFLKERSVVYQERLWRIDNNADGFLYFTLHNLAYKASPYRWTPIGFAYDIRHYTIGMLRDYYKRYYSPNNAVIVVSGDIEEKRVLRLIKRLFGKKRPKTIDRHITKEPKQMGRRIAYIEKPSEFKKMAIAFKIPPASDNDTVVLDLISYMLFDGKTALAYDNLVRKKNVLVDIDGGNEGRIYDKGLFEIFADLSKKTKFDPARAAVLNQISLIKAGKFDDELLRLAKQKARMDYYLSQQTLGSRNRNMAFYAAFGLLNYYNNYIKLIDSVKKSDVVRVARKYFTQENETDVFLIPQKGAVLTKSSSFRGVLR